jgi:hypothetical protein
MQTATKTALILMLAWTSHVPSASAAQDPPVASAQAPRAGQTAGDFATRVEKYVELRASLESGLPVLTGADDPVLVRNVELALADRMRKARGRARQGDIFTPEAAATFRAILRDAIDAATWKALMDEDPGVFPHQVNNSYPKSRPLSTMPASLLARLPRLPDGLQYRFVGSDLILHDTKSNLIVDRLPEAISRRGPR